VPKPTEPMIPPSMEAPDGMHTLYADRCDTYSVSYIPDVVYDTRDGIPLHLQMLYPGMAPMSLLMERMAAAMPTPPQDRSDMNGHRPPASENPMPGFQNEPNKYPLIVFVQGSAWMKQDCYQGIPRLVDFARKGYVVASVEYRPSMVAPWPGFLLDVKAAIRYLRANAERFDIDKDRIAIWGDSSGGHAALMVGATGWTREFDDDLCGEESSAVRAVVDFYGLSDITRLPFYPRDPMYLNSPDNMVPENILFRTRVLDHPEVCAPANPINYIHRDKNYPPFLIMHGDEDGTVPFNQSVLMYNKLVECGKSVDFYKVKGAGHGVRFWTKEVLDVVASFLRAYL